MCIRDRLHSWIICIESHGTVLRALVDSLVPEGRHMDRTDRYASTRSGITNEGIRTVHCWHAGSSGHVCEESSSATFWAQFSVVIWVVVGLAGAVAYTVPCGVVAEEVVTWIAQRYTVFGLVVGIEVGGTVFWASSIDSLGYVASGTLAYAIPSGIVSKITRRTQIHTSPCWIISILVSAAVNYTLRVKNVSIGELGLVGTGEDTILSHVLCKVVVITHHWAGLNANADGAIVGMREGKEVLALWTNCHTTPCAVISKEIYNVKCWVDPLRADTHASSEGVVRVFVGLVVAGLMAAVGVEISEVGRSRGTHLHADSRGIVCEVGIGTLLYTGHGARISVEVGSGGTGGETPFWFWVFV